jgi:hypothetical protein
MSKDMYFILRALTDLEPPVICWPGSESHVQVRLCFSLAFSGAVPNSRNQGDHSSLNTHVHAYVFILRFNDSLIVLFPTKIEVSMITTTSASMYYT